MPGSFLCLLFFVSVSVASASNFVKSSPGTANIIVTAPHGGTLTPGDMNERLLGCKTNTGCYYNSDPAETCKRTSQCPSRGVPDSYTREIADRVAQAITEELQASPYLVKVNLRRSMLDANRDPGEAAQGDPEAIEAYNEFHDKIQEFKEEIAAKGKRGLLIDIHGQAHGNDSTEFGYGLYKSQIIKLRNDQGYSSYETRNTMAGLFSKGGYTLKEFLMGSDSLGGLLEDEGYAAIPGVNRPGEGEGSDDFKYFSGGFIAQKYGSSGTLSEDGIGSAIDSVQAEVQRERRFNATLRNDFSEALGRAVAKFYRIHYD